VDVLYDIALHESDQTPNINIPSEVIMMLSVITQNEVPGVRKI